MLSQQKYSVPKRTALRKFETKKGVSKKTEYLQIEGAACKIIKQDSETVTLNSLTSAISRNFTISHKEFDIEFTEINPDSDGYLHLDSYTVLIHITEFGARELVTSLEKKIKQIIKNKNIDPRVIKILQDKISQLIVSQGGPYITISDYDKYKKGEITLTSHKRFANPIFNRNSRCCPPIDITHEEYKKSPSYPAPLGIRPKDFCLPSELIITMEELINQIVNFDGIDDVSFEEMKKILPFIHKIDHCCKYCDKKINIEEYCSEYKSCDNFIEICHRDPNDRFLARNMYWGHGECNRRQGGYSETDRKRDGLHLLWVHGNIDSETYERVLKLL